MPADLLIRNARPMGGPAADILVRDGRIAEIRAGIAPPPGVRAAS